MVFYIQVFFYFIIIKTVFTSWCICYNLSLEHIERQTKPGEGGHQGGNMRRKVHGGGVWGLGEVGKFALFSHTTSL